jgi:hypothetical protein
MGEPRSGTIAVERMRRGSGARSSGPLLRAIPNRRYELDGSDVLGFLTLAAGRDVELDPLTVLERLVALSLDLREVDEHVLALVTRDESVTLLGVEELHSALCHSVSFSCFDVVPPRLRPCRMSTPLATYTACDSSRSAGCAGASPR